MTRRVDAGHATSLADLRKELLVALKTGDAASRGAATSGAKPSGESTSVEDRPLATARVPFSLPVAKPRRISGDEAAQNLTAKGVAVPPLRPHVPSAKPEPVAAAKAPEGSPDLGQIAGLVGRCLALPELAMLLVAGVRLAAAKIA